MLKIKRDLFNDSCKSMFDVYYKHKVFRNVNLSIYFILALFCLLFNYLKSLFLTTANYKVQKQADFLENKLIFLDSGNYVSNDFITFIDNYGDKTFWNELSLVRPDGKWSFNLKHLGKFHSYKDNFGIVTPFFLNQLICLFCSVNLNNFEKKKEEIIINFMVALNFSNLAKVLLENKHAKISNSTVIVSDEANPICRLFLIFLKSYNRGNKVFHLQHGLTEKKFKEWQNSLADYFLLVGQKSKAQLDSVLSNKKESFIVGSYVINRSPIPKKFEKSFEAVFFHQPYYKSFGDKENYQKVLDTICQTMSEHSRCMFIVKPHPSEKKNKSLKKFLGLTNVRIERDWSAMECLASSRLVITCFSQTAYLAYFHNIPLAIVYNNNFKVSSSYYKDFQKHLVELKNFNLWFRKEVSLIKKSRYNKPVSKRLNFANFSPYEVENKLRNALERFI